MVRSFFRALAALFCLIVVPLHGDVLLITLDTTRADHLSCYGYEKATTPAMDAFAKGGVRFIRAYTPVPITLPSHTTMLTGLWPKDHGVRDNMMRPLSVKVPTAASLFKAAGWRSAAFVSSYALDHRFGLSRDFDRYDDHMTFNARPEDEINERPGDETARAVEAFLAGLGDGPPLFLWVHFYDPHHPYLKHADTPTGMGDYDGEILHMDRAVGRILEAWRKTRKGLVLIVGDHGESLGEHGEPFHGVFLYEADVHVPLLLQAPGPLAGGVDDRWVSTTDILPTLLDYAGIAAAGLPGRSLLKTAPPHERLYFESLLPANSYGWTPPFAVLSPPLIYIHLPKPELYDLAADPHERNNLADHRRAEARGMLNALKSEYTVVFSPQTDGPDPEAVRKLEALGYRGGSAAHPGRDPKDLVWVVAELDRGEALEGKKDVRGAEASYRKIIAANPENYPALIKLGNLLKGQGRREESSAVFRQALSSNPGYVHAHFNVAVMDFEDGNFDAAAKEFHAVRALAPENPDAYYYLLRIALNAGLMEEARSWLRQAEGVDPGGPNLFFYRGLLSAKNGDLEAAARQFLECLSRKADYTEAQVNLAQAYYGLGRAGDSIDAYRKALAMDPDQPQVYLTLGSIFLKDRDDAAQALRYFQLFLSRYPRRAEAANVRDIVRDLGAAAP